MTVDDNGGNTVNYEPNNNVSNTRLPNIDQFLPDRWELLRTAWQAVLFETFTANPQKKTLGIDRLLSTTTQTPWDPEAD